MFLIYTGGFLIYTFLLFYLFTFLPFVYISLSDILVGINSSISQEWPPAAHMLAMV